MATRIVILSDTHRGRAVADLGASTAEVFASADLILHTGDVTDPAVLDWLDQFAPVLCALGNHDAFEDARASEIVFLEREGWRIGAKHQVLDRPHAADRVTQIKHDIYRDPALDILIAGDTHYERLEFMDDTLLVNSGSATLPHNYNTRPGSVAVLDLTPDSVRVELLRIADAPGLRNPAIPGHIRYDRSGVVSASIDGVPVEDVATGAGASTIRWPSRHGAPTDAL